MIPIMFMAFTAAAGVIANLVMKRRREGGRVHPTLWFMLTALGMHWVFLAVHTLHLRAYAGTLFVGLVNFYTPLFSVQGADLAEARRVLHSGVYDTICFRHVHPLSLHRQT